MRTRPTLLGWLIIVYSGFLSSHIFSVIGIIQSSDLASDWLLLLDGATWLALLIGGLGLVRLKMWGKWVVVSASAVQLILASILIVSRTSQQEAVNSDTIWMFIGSLPAIFFLIAALQARSSEASLSVPIDGSAPTTADAAMATNLRQLDRAYGSFACVAGLSCVAALVAVLSPILPGALNDEGVGALFGMLVVVILWVTLGLGLVLSAMHWREWQLPVMSTIAISLIVIGMLWAEEKAVSAQIAGTFAIAGVAAMIFFCVSWFFFRRKQLTQTQQPN